MLRAAQVSIPQIPVAIVRRIALATTAQPVKKAYEVVDIDTVNTCGAGIVDTSSCLVSKPLF